MLFPYERLVVSLDMGDESHLSAIVNELSSYINTFKIGPEVIMTLGLDEALGLLLIHGARAFVDLKLNDIPSTVYDAARIMSHYPNLKYFTVHASAGQDAMREARAATPWYQHPLAVTVLTSLDEEKATSIFGSPPAAKVVEFAQQAYKAGIRGLVCPARYLKVLSEYDFAKEMFKVVPGIRPSWAMSSEDHAAAATPTEAILLGADILVVGRPVIYPPQSMIPKQAVEAILAEITDALQMRGEDTAPEIADVRDMPSPGDLLG